MPAGFTMSNTDLYRKNYRWYTWSFDAIISEQKSKATRVTHCGLAPRTLGFSSWNLERFPVQMSRAHRDHTSCVFYRRVTFSGNKCASRAMRFVTCPFHLAARTFLFTPCPRVHGDSSSIGSAWWRCVAGNWACRRDELVSCRMDKLM